MYFFCLSCSCRYFNYCFITFFVNAFPSFKVSFTIYTPGSLSESTLVSVFISSDTKETDITLLSDKEIISMFFKESFMFSCQLMVRGPFTGLGDTENTDDGLFSEIFDKST